MSTVANVQSRIAGLAEGADTTISGVAIAPGDITRGLSGDRKVWTAEELRAAAATLEGTPVNPLHSQAEVGEVARAGFDPDRGVIYEVDLDDAKLAQQVAEGQLEVSIEARHADGGTVDTDQGEAMLATDIEFTGLAMVQHGAAPSASAQPGEAAALTPAAIQAALEEDAPASTEGDASDIEISESQEEAIQTQLEEHKEAGGRDVSMGTLKKVYRRGAGAWLNSNAGATQQQWALARVEAFLADLRNGRPLNEGNDNDLAPEGYEPAEAAAVLAEVNGEEVDLTPPEAVVNAAEAALEAKRETYAEDLGDCGTGVGEDRAEQIVDGDLAPEDFTSGGAAETAIPDYLDSHSDDVSGIDEPPTEWGEATWTDGCGPVQYALWGGTATGTGLEWAQSTADAVEAAMEDADAAEADLKAVGPVEFDDTGRGELDESEIPNDDYEGHYLNAEDTKSASSFPLVDADGTLRRGNLDAAWDLRGQGDLGMPRDAAERVLKSLGREFGEPGSEANPIPEEAYESESAAESAPTDDAVSPERGLAEDGTGPHSATTNADDTPMSDDNPDPEERVTELKAELSDLREELDEKEAELESLRDERDEVARAYAGAIVEHGETVFGEDDLVDRFDVAELRERVEEMADDDAEAALAPTIQSGGGETDTESASLGADGKAIIDDLGADSRDEAVDILEDRLAKYERRDWTTNAEGTREQLATLGAEVTDA